MSKKKQTTLLTTLGTRSRTSVSVAEGTDTPPSDNELDTRQATDDGNNATQLQLMKEMIDEMRDSINKNTETLLAEVRRDIGELNEKFDKNNARFEEAEGRISNLEDRMQNAEDINTEVDSLRELILAVRKEYNYDACNARKNNIIIQGMKGYTKDPRGAMKKFETFCLDEMGLGKTWVKELDMKEVYMFPAKKREDPWLLFASFNKSIQREDFYKAAPNLKGKGFGIRNDLAPCLIAERKQLHKIAEKLQENPTNYKTRHRDTPFKVWIETLKPGENKWETWEVEAVQGT